MTNIALSLSVELSDRKNGLCAVRQKYADCNQTKW